MPPKGWRNSLPPPGYIFKKEKTALKYQGLSSSEDPLPLPNVYPPSSTASSSSPSNGALRNKNRARDLKRAEERRVRDDRVGEPLKKRRRRERTSTSPSVDGAAAQLQEGEEVGWIDDEPRKMEREESKSVLGGHQYEGWEEEEDTVWVGFKEDCYRVVEQLPLELHRSYELMAQLDGQVENTKEEITARVRAYVETRRGQALPRSATVLLSHPTTVDDSRGGIKRGISGHSHPPEVDGGIGESAAGEVNDASPRPTVSSVSQSVSSTVTIQPNPSDLTHQSLILSPHLTPPQSESILDLPSYALSSDQPSQPLPPSSSCSNFPPPKTQFQPSPQHTSSRSTTSSPSSRSQLLNLASLLTHLLQTSSHKVVLAQDCYDRVDRQIQELDIVLERHRASIPSSSEAARTATLTSNIRKEVDASAVGKERFDFGKGGRVGRENPRAGMEMDEDGREGSAVGVRLELGEERVYDSQEDAIGEEYDEEEKEDGSMMLVGREKRMSVPRGSGYKGKGVAAGERGGRGRGVGLQLVQESALVGMAVDPNEPRYCYCKGVSHGEMIGCDNEDCEKGWFHLGCVGAVPPTKGKWFCKDCAKGAGSAGRRRR